MKYRVIKRVIDYVEYEVEAADIDEATEKGAAEDGQLIRIDDAMEAEVVSVTPAAS